MGRQKIEIDPVLLHEMASQGWTQREMAKYLGISHVTLARRMAEIKNQKGILLKYRSIQTLQLTELQYRALEAISDEKIKDSSLLELVKAFQILKKLEPGIEKDRIKMTGLVAHLEALEEEMKKRLEE